MKIKLILFGSSYHAQVVISEIENLGNYDIIGYIDKSSRKKKFFLIKKFYQNYH